MHRNKHRKTVKMGRQRTMAQRKEQIKTPEKEVNKMEIKQPIRCRVQNTGYKNAQGT